MMADGLTLRIIPTLRGFVVAADAAPAAMDPLGQRAVRESYATLDQAVEALPRLARAEIERLVTPAAQREGREL